MKNSIRKAPSPLKASVQCFVHPDGSWSVTFHDNLSYGVPADDSVINNRIKGADRTFQRWLRLINAPSL